MILSILVQYCTRKGGQKVARCVDHLHTEYGVQHVQALLESVDLDHDYDL